MGIAQNLNHKLSCVDKVNLDYEHFSNPFAPIINSIISFDYIPPAADFIKIRLELESDNIINYSTGQKLSVNTAYGKNTIFNLFAGYSWNQTHNNSYTLKQYKTFTEGFNYGFNLDTGLLKFDYITWSDSNYGYGTISLDFINIQKHNWQKTDINFYTGLSFFINTEFLETQVQTAPVNNFSIYLNEKYVSGFKTNKINPSPYRYERDYELLTMGIKYEQPLPFLQNWVTPYVELGTGIASFGIQKLANHLPDLYSDSYKYDTKFFWQLQANLGLDIIPQGLLNFGSAAYSLTVFAGTIFIPDSAGATKQIMQDTYRTDDWKLQPFEFVFGFALHMGLDF